MLHVVAFFIGVCELDPLIIYLFNRGAFSLQKFNNFSQALLNSTSSCNQRRIPAHSPYRHHRRQGHRTCFLDIVSNAVN